MKRPLCVAGIVFLVSSLIANMVSAIYLCVILAMSFLVLLLTIFVIKTTLKSGVILSVVILILAFSLFYVKETYEYSDVINLENQEKTITATVTDYKESHGKYTYTIEVNDVKGEDIDSFKTYMYVNKCLDLEYYQEFETQVKFFLPGTTFSFDGIAYNKSNEVYIVSSVVDPDNITFGDIDKNIFYHCRKLNQKVNEVAKDYLSGNTLSVFENMILGNSDDIPFELEEMYKNTGTIHIFSISGTHVSIVSIILIFVLGLLPIHKRIKWILVLVCIWLFILFSGYHIASIRAGIMASVLILGKIMYRKSNSLNSLCISVMIILINNIYTAVNVGFWMSVLAVGGIIILADRINKIILRGSKSKILEFLASCISVNVSVNIFLLPISIFFFEYISVVSLLSNIFITLIAFVTILSGVVFSVCVMLFTNGIVVNFVGSVLSYFCEMQNEVLGFFANFPIKTIGLNDTIIKLSLLVAIGLFIFAIIYMKKQNIIVVALFLTVDIVAFGFFSNMYYNNDTIQIYATSDFATSNLILIENGRAFVISTKDDDYIDEQTVSFLKTKGINDVKTLFLCYNNSRYYKDTQKLVSSINVDYIFYNNYDLTFLKLAEKNDMQNIIALDDLEIQISDNIIMNIYFDNNHVSFDIFAKDKKISISNDIEHLQIPKTYDLSQIDVAFIYGQVYDPIVDVNCDEVYILEKQYDNVMSNIEFKNLIDYNKKDEPIFKIK